MLVQARARIPPVDKTLKRYNDRIQLLMFRVSPRSQMTHTTCTCRALLPGTGTSTWYSSTSSYSLPHSAGRLRHRTCSAVHVGTSSSPKKNGHKKNRPVTRNASGMLCLGLEYSASTYVSLLSNACVYQSRPKHFTRIAKIKR